MSSSDTNWATGRKQDACVPGDLLAPPDVAFRQVLPVLLVLMFAELSCAFETSLVIAGMKAWVRVSGEPIKAGWLMTSYLLVASPSAALCGRLGDLFGHRRMLAVVLAVCAIGSAVSALGPTLGWVIAGRALQGLSGAIIPLAFALAREHVPARYLSMTVGAIVGTLAIGGALGLVAGGILSDRFGPQSVFYASFVMTGLGAMLVLLFMPRGVRRRRGRQLDISGALLLTLGITGPLLAISNIEAQGVNSPLAVWPGAAGVLLLVVWIIHELRHPDPLIDVRLLVRRENLLANLILTGLAIGAFQILVFLAILIQSPTATGIGLGATATLAGLVKFPAFIVGSAGSLWSGQVAKRHGARVPILCGTAITSAGLLLLLFFRHSLVEIGIVAFVLNFGLMAAYAGVPLVILSTMPADRTGEATGMMSALRFVSSGAGAQIVVVLLATNTIAVGGARFPTAAAFNLTLFFMLAASTFAFLCAFFLHGKLASSA